MRKTVIILLAILYVIPSFSQTMEWHIKDNYVDIKYMGNNLFKVKKSSGKWGVINEYGETTVEIQYDSITPIVENRALLLDNTGQFLNGIINEKGQLLKSFPGNDIYVSFPYFKEGMLAYGVDAGGYDLFGYLDINGNMTIAPQYYWAAPFNDGKAVIQHKRTKNYGLINKTGGSVLYDNRKFKFMSTPVDNKLLIAVGSNRGDEISLVTLGANGKLNEVEKLEKKTGYSVNVNVNDYKTISYQNGNRYYFDNAMRLVSSSTGKKFNDTLTYDVKLPNSSNFTIRREQGGWKIMHSGKVLLYTSFRSVSFCGNEYAIVTSHKNTKGVLKLNNNGNISVQNIPTQAEFYHNASVKGNVSVSIDGLFAKSQVQIGVVKGNNQEERYNVSAGFSGIHNESISYFIPATNFDSEVSLPIKVNLYIDGMLYKTETKSLTGVHRKAFKVSDANANEYSNPDGTETITFTVQSLKSKPSSSAKVIVSGDTNQTKRFNDEELLYFKVPVKVPMELEKTFSFIVTIKEDGCPSYTKTIKRTIKHYDLQ